MFEVVSWRERAAAPRDSACAPPDPAGTEAETINNNVTLRVSERLFGRLIDKQEGLTD